MGPLKLPGNLFVPSQVCFHPKVIWGFFSPPSPQLQGHLHLKWELDPLAACLLLIAGAGCLLGH